MSENSYYIAGMSDLNEFRSEVESFMERKGISPTRFGRMAVNDAMFISQLRAGREPRYTTRQRVMDFISSHPAPSRNGEAA